MFGVFTNIANNNYLSQKNISPNTFLFTIYIYSNNMPNAGTIILCSSDYGPVVPSFYYVVRATQEDTGCFIYPHLYLVCVPHPSTHCTRWHYNRLFICSTTSSRKRLQVICSYVWPLIDAHRAGIPPYHKMGLFFTTSYRCVFWRANLLQRIRTPTDLAII